MDPTDDVVGMDRHPGEEEPTGVERLCVNCVSHEVDPRQEPCATCLEDDERPMSWTRPSFRPKGGAV